MHIIDAGARLHAAASLLYYKTAACKKSLWRKDDREWLFVFPFPPIPMQSIPLTTVHYCFISVKDLPVHPHQQVSYTRRDLFLRDGTGRVGSSKTGS